MPFPSTARERSLAFNESLRTGNPLYPDLNLEDLGIDPLAPCTEPPGSEGKILVLQARYQEGMELWNDRDAGFGETDLYRNFFEACAGRLSDAPEEPSGSDIDDDATDDEGE